MIYLSGRRDLVVRRGFRLGLMEEEEEEEEEGGVARCEGGLLELPMASQSAGDVSLARLIRWGFDVT